MTLQGQGAEDYARLARALKAAGRKDLQRELGRAVREGGKVVRGEGRVVAVEWLPSRGGLGPRTARAAYRTRMRAGRSPSVTVVASLRKQDGGGKVDLRAMDRGRLRHPVFGRGRWVTQQIRPGWWSEVGLRSGRKARRLVEAGMDRVRQQLERSTR